MGTDKLYREPSDSKSLCASSAWTVRVFCLVIWNLYIFTNFRSLIWWFQLLCWMQSMLPIFSCARLWHSLLYCCPAFLPFCLTRLSADTQTPEIKDWSKIIPVNQDVLCGSYLFIGSFQDAKTYFIHLCVWQLGHTNRSSLVSASTLLWANTRVINPNPKIYGCQWCRKPISIILQFKYVLIAPAYFNIMFLAFTCKFLKCNECI